MTKLAGHPICGHLQGIDVQATQAMIVVFEFQFLAGAPRASW